MSQEKIELDRIYGQLLRKNYFEILGVTPQSTKKEIIVAADKMSKRFSHSNFADDISEATMLKLNVINSLIRKATKTLTNPELREGYIERLQIDSQSGESPPASREMKYIDPTRSMVFYQDRIKQIQQEEGEKDSADSKKDDSTEKEAADLLDRISTMKIDAYGDDDQVESEKMASSQEHDDLNGIINDFEESLDKDDESPKDSDVKSSIKDDELDAKLDQAAQTASFFMEDLIDEDQLIERLAQTPPPGMKHKKKDKQPDEASGKHVSDGLKKVKDTAGKLEEFLRMSLSPEQYALYQKKKKERQQESSPQLEGVRESMSGEIYMDMENDSIDTVRQACEASECMAEVLQEVIKKQTSEQVKPDDSVEDENVPSEQKTYNTEHIQRLYDASASMAVLLKDAIQEHDAQEQRKKQREMGREGYNDEAKTAGHIKPSSASQVVKKLEKALKGDISTRGQGKTRESLGIGFFGFLAIIIGAILFFYFLYSKYIDLFIRLTYD